MNRDDFSDRLLRSFAEGWDLPYEQFVERFLEDGAPTGRMRIIGFDPVPGFPSFEFTATTRDGSAFADEIKEAFAAWAAQPDVAAMRERMRAAWAAIGQARSAGPLLGDELRAALENVEKADRPAAERSYQDHDPTIWKRRGRRRRK